VTPRVGEPANGPLVASFVTPNAANDTQARRPAHSRFAVGFGILIARNLPEAHMRSLAGNTHGRAVSEVAERQMRRWALDLQTQQRLAEEDVHKDVPQLIHPYIAISREAGVDAGELAGAVGAECGWNVLDGELLDHLAEHDHLSRLALEFVDERTVSWFHEMFGKWLEKQLVSQAEYVSRLGKLVLLAAQHESSIFVGRGVQFMLPRERGLAVRVIAPLKQRARWMMEKKHCTEREAERHVQELDTNRANFIQRYFHRDNSDPHLYDLVINLEFIPRQDAINMIARQARLLAERLNADAANRAPSAVVNGSSPRKNSAASRRSRILANSSTIRTELLRIQLLISWLTVFQHAGALWQAPATSRGASPPRRH
jgi:hypothetical protein